MASIGFIGCGQMAGALAHGFLQAGQASADSLVASDVMESSRKAFAERTKGRTTQDNREVVENSDVVFLAVKPQVMDKVLAEIAGVIGPRHLLVSIAAGIPLKRILDAVGSSSRVVRVMPNTPCLIGAAACGFAIGGSATQDDVRLIQQLLESVGIAYQVEEYLLDAVTGLSGSGPAYVYQFIEALSDGGVKAGLPRPIATALAAQTVLGAAKMVLETGKHPGELKDMVTSPGGTTITGLSVLENRGVRGAVIDAVEAATNRSRELGNK